MDYFILLDVNATCLQILEYNVFGCIIYCCCAYVYSTYLWNMFIIVCKLYCDK